MINREVLNNMGYEHSIVFENPDYDDAIIGVSHDDRVIYDYELMIEYLVENDGMTEEDAADFISYDTLRSLTYIGEPLKPIVMYPLFL